MLTTRRRAGLKTIGAFSVNYRNLGATGLEVSALSLGVSAFGGAYGPVDDRGCKDCVDQALSLGINLIDTSPYYGLTKSEEVLGRCLSGIPRDRYILSTKIGRYGLTIDQFDFSADRVRRSVNESLQRLRVDHVDIILCHDVEFGSLDQVVEETIPTLREVVKQGKARFVGISGLPLKIYREVLGRVDLDVILSYAHYTLNDGTLNTLLPFLESKNVGIINAAPFSMGLLTEAGPPEWHPAPPEVRDACRRAVEFCKSRGERLERLALQFSTRNEHVHTTLVGTPRASEINENVHWIEANFNKELFEEVRQILEPIQGVTWMSGRPENN